MPIKSVNVEQGKFAPSALLDLFILDARALGIPDLYYFTNEVNPLGKPLIYDGETYDPVPISIENVEIDGKGSLPRPRLSVTNIGGFLSQILYDNDNLVGTTVIRKRVFARFLDDDNFPDNKNPWGTPDTEAYQEDIYFINRKTLETNQQINFELCTALEVEGAKLPSRQILALVCPFRFRDADSCAYAGPPVADKNNKTFTGPGGWGFSSLTDQGEYDPSTTYQPGDYVYMNSLLPQTYGERTYFVCNRVNLVGNENSPLRNAKAWLIDACSRSPLGCRLHFPGNAVLRGGFFPGVTRSRIYL